MPQTPEEKATYWKSRMQDQLHTFDNEYTTLQSELLHMAKWADLNGVKIIQALNDVRTDMKALSRTIEEAKIMPSVTTVTEGRKIENTPAK